MSLIDYAKKYKKLGLSIIPTDDYKRPIIAWTPYQTNIIEDLSVFENERAKGLAIICGAVSGNLEVIDIDCKYDISGTLYEDFKSKIEFFDKLVVAKTKNGGYHILYKCEVIEGNQKLANREATEEEKKDNPNVKVLVLIETRGEKGYICAKPTAGYEFIQGSPKDIPVISLDERDALLTAARSFNTYVEPYHEHVEATRQDNALAISPFADYNNRGNIIELLQRHGWIVVKDDNNKVIFKRPGNTLSKSSGDYHREKNLFTVFTTSSQFEPLKGYKPAAVFTLLECNGDWKESAKKLLEEGYGKKKTRQDTVITRTILKYKELGATDDEIIDELKMHNRMEEDRAKKEVEIFNSNEGEQYLTFWDVTFKRDNFFVEINRTRLLQFLQEKGGFYLYFYDKKSNIFRIIKDDNGIIEEASTEQIKKFLKKYIYNLPQQFDNITKDDLMEIILKGSGVFFSDQYLEFMEHYSPDFLKDTADTSYFPFKNGVVCVSKNKVEIKSYGELNKCIWKSQVIDHNINIAEESNPEVIDFFRFIKKICNDDGEKIKYAMSLIGYLLHKYKDPIKPYAVILAEESEDDSKGGGTGKGIFVSAISKMLATEQVDGKNFKLDKSFAFQRVGLDTRLVAIQDIRKNVDFEGFYSIITEGITIEKKNKDELYIPYADSPKIMFTTNYTINNTSNHASRRQKVLEFGGFFHPGNTPLDYFGHRLFDDWDESQWSLFYNFMFACTQFYLKEGVLSREESETSKIKRIRIQFGEEFEQWFNEYSNNGCDKVKMFSDLYSNFCLINDFEKREYSQKRFKKALKDSSQIMGWELKDRINRQSGGKIECWMAK